MIKKKKTCVTEKPIEKEQTVDSTAVTTKIYVGPTVPNIIKKNNVYNGELPLVEREFLKEHPFFNSLLIKVESLPEFINSQQYSILFEKAANSLRR